MEIKSEQIIESSKESKVFAKLNEVFFEPLSVTKVDRLRKFFDLSLWKWFIPGCSIIVGILTAFIGYYAVNVEHYIVRCVLISVAIVIILAALVAVAAYKAYIPLESILGSIVEQRYISNALGGVYFGTQVVRWVFSLYFYDENSEQPQSSLALRVLFVAVISLCFVSSMPIFLGTFK